jgi:phage shock protein C
MAIYCRTCGRALADDARFCSVCGTQTVPPVPYPPSVTRLVRPRAGRMLAGVCQGLANAYAWDVVWVRVITVLLAVFTGAGLLAYIIFWIVMPEEAVVFPPPPAPYQPPTQP